ncbi:hypothetical protein [Pleionea sediminis]|uniref:hypothetical protein n=1 Tax=Pleionea sediminis TaxID=2569479 RepID=UPI001186D426|nr:hypothetical protein [Pleionea sediminis]
MYRYLLMVLLSTLLLGCKHMESDDQGTSEMKGAYIKIFNSENKSLISLTNPEDVMPIIKMIEQREKVLLKRLPIFTHTLEVFDGKTTATWEFVGEGIIQPTNIKGTDLQRISSPELITKHLK